jgi:hypothetical protein
MPTYSFKHSETGETLTTFCSWDEAQELTSSGDYKMLPSAPMIVRGRGDVVSGTDRGFNDVLDNIKSHHRGSTIQTK